MKVILWRRPDGGFSFTVTQFLDEDKAREHAEELVTSSRFEPTHRGFQFQGICDDNEMPDGGCTNKTSMASAYFKGAWDVVNGKPVLLIEKAKNIAHARRREMRDVEMKPLDIEATIPDKAAHAEAERQIIRDKYAQMQIAIDAATTPEQLKSVLS